MEINCLRYAGVERRIMTKEPKIVEWEDGNLHVEDALSNVSQTAVHP